MLQVTGEPLTSTSTCAALGCSSVPPSRNRTTRNGLAGRPAAGTVTEEPPSRRKQANGASTRAAPDESLQVPSPPQNDAISRVGVGQSGQLAEHPPHASPTSATPTIDRMSDDGVTGQGSPGVTRPSRRAGCQTSTSSCRTTSDPGTPPAHS